MPSPGSEAHGAAPAARPARLSADWRCCPGLSRWPPRAQPQPASQPPSATSTDPVMYEASGEHSHTAAAAISSGSAIRPSGTVRSNSSLTAEVMPVRVTPGAMALTRIPVPPSSSTAEHRGRVHDGARPLGPHAPDLSPHAPPDASQVNLEDAHEVILLILIQGNVRPGHTGVVERGVEPAEGLHGASYGLGNSLQVRDVGLQHHGARPERPGGGRGVLKAVGIDVHERHRSAG